MKIMWNGIEWGKVPESDDVYFFYIYWFDWVSNKELRVWGENSFWYDGPHKWYCFWYFSIGWSTPWTSWKSE
jgi:hypothetical protein